MSRKSRYGGDEIIVRKLMLQETGTFHDIYNRSFQMDLNDTSIDSIRQRLNGAGRGSLNRQSFRGMASGILVPSAEIHSSRDLIDIPDGWDRPRCRWMLEVEVKSRLGDESVYFFQGFTDHHGMGRSGSVDPDMMFYCNGFIRVSYVTRRDDRGTYEVAVVKESAQIIDGKLLFDKDYETTKTRTVDLYANIQERILEHGFVDRLDDSRTVLNSPIDSIMAQRKDNLPGEYISSSLETYRRNTDLLSFGTDRGDIIDRTHANLNSEVILLSSNPVLSRLAQIQGQHSCSSFTMKDLFDLDPEATQPGVVEGTILDQKARGQLAHRDGDVSDWRGSTQEARWATQIANGLASVMLSHYHQKLEFMIDNLGHGHEIILRPIDSAAVAQTMPIQIFERMLDNIDDIFYDLSGGNIDDFSVHVRANLYDQTEIFISLHGQPEQRFYVPQFADALMSPFYTRDRQKLTDLSEDLENLLNDLSGEISGSASAVSSSTV